MIFWQYLNPYIKNDIVRDIQNFLLLPNEYVKNTQEGANMLCFTIDKFIKSAKTNGYSQTDTNSMHKSQILQENTMWSRTIPDWMADMFRMIKLPSSELIQPKIQWPFKWSCT